MSTTSSLDNAIDFTSDSLYTMPRTYWILEIARVGLWMGTYLWCRMAIGACPHICRNAVVGIDHSNSDSRTSGTVQAIHRCSREWREDERHQTYYAASHDTDVGSIQSRRQHNSHATQDGNQNDQPTSGDKTLEGFCACNSDVYWLRHLRSLKSHGTFTCSGLREWWSIMVP